MNPYRSDLNLFAVFQAVLETRSVTLAAERFGITQPAMSNALGRLREMVHDQLFVNTSNGMQPTPYALQIAGPIAEALRGLEAAITQNNEFVPLNSDQTFRFHITDMGQINIIPSLLERMQEVAPNIKIDVVTRSLEEIRSDLEEGHIHFSLGHLPKLHGRNIHSEKLFNERYVVLMRSDHPLAQRLTQKAFLGASHAVVTSVGGGHHIVEEFLTKKRVCIRARLPNIMAIAMALSRTDLIATIPRRVATELAKAGTLKIRELPFNFPGFEVRVYWHQRSQGSAANVWMRTQIIDLFSVRDR